MVPTAHILTDESLTVFFDGKPSSIHASDPDWEAAREAVYADNWDDLLTILNKAAAVAAWAKDTDLTVKDDMIWYDGEQIDNSLTRRILKMVAEKRDTSALVNFMKNLMQNPSRNSVEQLYEFLAKNDLPITPDGHFLAYKLIKQDWTDCYTGKFDNSVGNTITMPRHRVDDDKHRTCSAGLHVCSLNYLKSFWGQRLIAVKVNPKDVVSVPTDYNNSKMRVCQYEVMQELDMELVGGSRDAWNESVVDPDAPMNCLPLSTDNEYKEGVTTRTALGGYIADYDNVDAAVNFELGSDSRWVAFDGNGHLYYYSVRPSWDDHVNAWEADDAENNMFRLDDFYLEDIYGSDLPEAKDSLI